MSATRRLVNLLAVICAAFPVAEGARVVIKDKEKGATLDDLKVGMVVRVWHHNGGLVQLIEEVPLDTPPKSKKKHEGQID